jgi:hypothetical protein
MGKKLSTFIGDSTYTRAPPNYRSPLRSNYNLLYILLNFLEGDRKAGLCLWSD